MEFLDDMPAQLAFSGPIVIFQDRALPERAAPAGYAALIGAYGLRVPLPRQLSAIGSHHRIQKAGGWQILTPRHAPDATLEGHLVFALKNEGLDLAILKRLFLKLPALEIEAIVRAKPTGAYSWRIWFLYEWLLGKQLDLPDAQRGTYEPVVDPEMQWATAGELSPRHRVRNNLPGTPEFCPLVFRTETLNQFVATDLAAQAQRAIADVPKDLLARTAAFLLLKDSRSSYAIEGERPPQDRIQRWGRAIGEAGHRPIDLEELLRLQALVIGDQRFVPLGLRDEGGFIGEHARDTREPLPAHISARAADLPSLMNGLAAFDRTATPAIDAVIAAAVLAFGFVYIHPFVDGNGRIHRYLIHHVLARRGFNPAGVVFPVSATILQRLDEYRRTLEGYSKALLPVIDWRPTATGNVEALSDTGDFYRFFDATPHAEFLYECVKQTIEQDLPRETPFLAQYDRFRARIDAMIDMPEPTLNLLFLFLRQSQGRLSRRARENEFQLLTDEEAARIEAAYRDCFETN